MRKYDSQQVEQKWQKRWFKAGIFQAEVDIKRPKFYIIFAYPNVSGYLHIGHMRGYTYTDVIARYKRMRGFNVLFPVGSHATGNIAISFAKRIIRGDKEQIEYLLMNGCPKETIPKLKDPEEVIKLFNEVYINDYWKRFGFLADWRRFTTSISSEYGKFIEWQFKKLKKKGLLIQNPYYSTFCPQCGPVAVDPSETDILKGGNAEKLEYILLKFKFNEWYLVAATLRPETVFGQTNFWVNPKENYVKAIVNGEKWIISRECAEKLRHQKDDVKIVGTVSGQELIGKYCKAPVIEREILILPSKFCDVKVGTGLVTSVPSDAPIDWMALHDLQMDEKLCKSYDLNLNEVRKIKPIPIIKTREWGDLAAVKLCQAMGINNQLDQKIDEATKIIYKAGFHTGTMNENCGEYAGMSVAAAKDKIKAEMIGNNEACVMYDLSEEVICRCGSKVIIKKIPDQWFIDYANPSLTKESIDHARTMDIYPKEYKDNLPGVLEWFKERACVRLGDWLGTKFPFDKKWTIEPIADSTLYSSFYIISKYVNSGEIGEEQMGEGFFDYIFLGKGNETEVSQKYGIEQELLRKIRNDFEYWYPLDINLGGKEHMTVHFPVFLMNHVAVLPKKCWPKGIFVNWWITHRGGDKIAKSKGGAVPIPYAVKKFSVDGLRLYYTHIASPHADVEWNEYTVQNYKQRIERTLKLFEKLEGAVESKIKMIDRWLLSRINTALSKIINDMENFDLRSASNHIFFGIFSDVKWYLKRNGKNIRTIEEVQDIWIRSMTPFTPHLSEELWEQVGKEDLVSNASYPLPDESKIDIAAELSEEFLKAAMEDISEILKVTKITPKKIILYTAAKWKNKLFNMAIAMAKSQCFDMHRLMKKGMEVDLIRDHSKEAAKYAQQLIKDARKMSKEDIERYLIPINEKEHLEYAVDFLQKEFNCKFSIHSCDDTDIYDPQSKAKFAVPWRPAIFVE